MIRRILAALLRRLFPATYTRSVRSMRDEARRTRAGLAGTRTISRDELEHLVMDYRRELGKRAR